MSAPIASVTADWMLDSRATPTVEVTVHLADGTAHRAMAPSGASTGSHESVERRDTDDPRWRGLGVSGAVEAVRSIVDPALRGCPADRQEDIDRRLVEADGTGRRDRIGANAMVAASVACARAGAARTGRPLWRHLARSRPPVLPVPMVNILSGALHAGGGMGIQDVLFVPLGAPGIEAALEHVHDVYHATRRILAGRGLSGLVGDEGGFGTAGLPSAAALEVVAAAIEEAGLRPGVDGAIAIDVAATHLARGPGRYALDGEDLDAAAFGEVLLGWVNRYPIVSVEDPFGEDDWDAWPEFTAAAGPAQVVGDDLIATHLDRLERAATTGAATAVLVKPNQIGTVTEALDVVEAALARGMNAVVSARSGETEDDWLADLAVASGAGQIKVGSVARSERLAKYNRLLRIARGPQAPAYAPSDRLLPGR